VQVSRSRLIHAPPERIWPFVDDLTQWSKWFTEAERAEVTGGDPAVVGRHQRMYGHARGKPTEIDSTVTAREPNRRLAWHHDAERVSGKPGPVVYAKSTDAEVTLVPTDAGTEVTYTVRMQAGGPIYWLIEHLLARRSIRRSFDTSLERLDHLATAS
jgi:carbon monoxide dehydrogenase subunit G